MRSLLSKLFSTPEEDMVEQLNCDLFSLRTGPFSYTVYYAPAQKLINCRSGRKVELWASNQDEHDDTVNSIPVIFFLFMFRKVYGIVNVSRSEWGSLYLMFSEGLIPLSEFNEFMLHMFNFWKDNRDKLTGQDLADLIRKHKPAWEGFYNQKQIEGEQESN